MQDARSLGVESLVLSKAYLESDIIWDNLKKSHLTAILKRTVLFLALVVVSLLILTPSYMVNAMSPLEQSLKESAGGFASYVQEWFAPMVTLCINFGFIPTLIDFSCELEDYRRKSSRQISIMNRIFFFMFMNTLIVPLAGSTQQAVAFLEALGRDGLETWPTLLSNNLLAQQLFYIKFIIQLTFISNGFWLIDFFHRLQTWILKRLHERKQQDSVVKTPFKDDYQFDLGYH